MRRLFLLLLLLCGLGLAQEKAADAGHQPALTIYNQNFFVAREYVALDLKAGVNRAQYVGVAAHLEPDSVILRDPGGRALQILEQNYRNDPISQELLLSLYEGKTIDFLVQRGDKQELVVTMQQPMLEQAPATRQNERQSSPSASPGPTQNQNPNRQPR
jgi:hypothetical protein